MDLTANFLHTCYLEALANVSMQLLSHATPVFLLSNNPIWPSFQKGQKEILSNGIVLNEAEWDIPFGHPRVSHLMLFTKKSLNKCTN